MILREMTRQRDEIADRLADRRARLEEIDFQIPELEGLVGQHLANGDDVYAASAQAELDKLRGSRGGYVTAVKRLTAELAAADAKLAAEEERAAEQEQRFRSELRYLRRTVPKIEEDLRALLLKHDVLGRLWRAIEAGRRAELAWRGTMSGSVREASGAMDLEILFAEHPAFYHLLDPLLTAGPHLVAGGAAPNVAQAAQMLGVGVQEVRRMISEGVLKAWPRDLVDPASVHAHLTAAAQQEQEVA